jgi:transcriptional regulator with XRE-family HTH domain
MSAKDLKAARTVRGLTQAQAADRLGVSQPYVAMLETGVRRLSARLARRVMKVYDLPPTVLPHTALHPPGPKAAAQTLANDLAALGYPGFAYLRPRNWKPKNPSEVLLRALAQDDLEARLVEALPWLLSKYSVFDQKWLVQEAKLRDLQNRLGFVATLTRRLAEREGDHSKARALSELEAVLQRSLLAREEALCRATLPDPERRWLEEVRSDDAKRWNLLTDWTADALRYAT